MPCEAFSIVVLSVGVRGGVRVGVGVGVGVGVRHHPCFSKVCPAWEFKRYFTLIFNSETILN